jgi:transcriptional regulator with XRE-family HTH domain
MSIVICYISVFLWNYFANSIIIDSNYEWRCAMGIGEMILQTLEAKGMSQKELAERLNIPTTTMNGYIKRGHEPDYALLKSIATILDVTTDYLLEFKPTSIMGKEEFLLLTQYRELNDLQKEIVSEQVKFIVSQNKRK